MATLPITPLESATSGQTPERQPALSKRSPIAISTADVSSFSSNHDFTPSQLPSPTSPNTKMTTESQEESGFELVNGNIKLFETEKVITEKNYATSTDTRGLIPVYEYQIGSNRTNKVIVDRQTGYVLITGIWKALGRLKTDVVKLIESQPSIAPVIRKIRGGVLDIQGTWLPFEIAKKLAQRVAWPLRDELVPIFGPAFSSSCLVPGQPGFGDLVLSDPPLQPPTRRTPRDIERRAKAKLAARAAQNNSSISTLSQAKASRKPVPDVPTVEDPVPAPRLPSPSPTPPATAHTSAPVATRQPKRVPRQQDPPQQAPPQQSPPKQSPPQQSPPKPAPKPAPKQAPRQSLLKQAPLKQAPLKQAPLKQASLKPPTLKQPLLKQPSLKQPLLEEPLLKQLPPNQPPSEKAPPKRAPAEQAPPKVDQPRLVQRPSQAGPVRQEWKGYGAPLQPSRASHYSYSPYSDPRFFSFAPNSYLPTNPYPLSMRDRSISNPYPVSEYGRQRIRLPSGTVLPPRSSFSSPTPSLATPIASLRSTISRPPSPMRGVSLDSEQQTIYA